MDGPAVLPPALKQIRFIHSGASIVPGADLADD
jgi:hypothetical protein